MKAINSLTENEQTLRLIANYLIKQKETLAVAESVTSGHIQALLSSAEKASKFYQGGITTYNLNQKAKHLEINPLKALSNNCVSEIVSKEMALGVCKLFSCDWGISITGYASLIPGDGINTLFAFYSVAHKGAIVLTSILVSGNEKDSTAVQKYYANHVITDFARFIEKYSFSENHSTSSDITCPQKP